MTTEQQPAAGLTWIKSELHAYQVAMAEKTLSPSDLETLEAYEIAESFMDDCAPLLLAELDRRDAALAAAQERMAALEQVARAVAEAGVRLASQDRSTPSSN